MNKPVRVILLDQAQDEFKSLSEKVAQQNEQGKQNTEEMQLLNSIRQKSEFLKSNPFYGNNIEKRKIPKSYAVDNLWRLELTKFWRMLYTIKGDQIEIICFILDILDHKRYNKKLGYKNR